MLISRELQEDTSLAIALCKEKAQSIYGASAELKIMKHEVSGDSPYPYGDVSDLTIYTSETREAAKKREEFVASIVVGSRVVASHGGETEYIAVFLLDNLLDDEKEARRQGITLAELKKRAELKKQAEGETALDRAAKRIAAKHGLRNDGQLVMLDDLIKDETGQVELP